jgi:hypothetical protein
MFTAAADHLRALGHTVLGGVLAPSSEEYLTSKFERRKRTHLILSLSERVHLCRLATATMPGISMHVCDWGWESVGDIMREIQKRVSAKDLIVVELAGSDVMLNPRKSLPPKGRMHLGFARSDADPKAVTQFVANCEREIKTTGTSRCHLLRGTPTAHISSTHILDTLFPSHSTSSSSSSASTSTAHSVPSKSSVISHMLHPEVAKWLATKWPTSRPI